MKRSRLTNCEVVGLVLLGVGWGGLIALIPYAPSNWSWLWGFILVLGGAVLIFGKPDPYDTSDAYEGHRPPWPLPKRPPPPE